MKITSRSAWGARNPSTSSGKPATVYQTTWANRTGFVVHYSAASKDQSVRAIQDYHIGKGWSDIGYNFLVRASTGEIYEGRYGTWMAVGAHASNHNTANIGVCVIGTNSDITPEAKASVLWLYKEACRRSGKSLAKRYHSGLSGASTECPGSNLRNWVISGMPEPETKTYKLGERTLSRGSEGSDVKELQNSLNKLGGKLVVDGDFGPLTESEVNKFKTKVKLSANGIFDKPAYDALIKALNPTPAPTPIVKVPFVVREQESRLFFAKTKSSPDVYVGDGLTSRVLTRPSSYYQLRELIKSRGATDYELQLFEFDTLEEVLAFVGTRNDI